MKKTKIFFDNIIYSLQKAGGISTYWTEITKRLINDNHEVYFIESKNDNIARQSLSINDSQIITNDQYPLLINRFLNVKLPESNKKFVFHSSYNRTTTNINALRVVTIHDFVHEKYYSGLRKWLHC